LRARIPIEVEKGWSLFVADDGGHLAAMAGIAPARTCISTSYSSRREYQGQNLGRGLLAFTRQQLPDEIHLRRVRGK